MSPYPKNKVTIDHLVENINVSSKKRDVSVTVLMGAGMSVTAGIPLAGEIVKDIRKEYENRFSDLSSDSMGAYQLHMAELSSGERRDLIRDYMESPDIRLNWAHIFLAQLIHEKVIDRVLTVNFDNLLAQALALFGRFPAIYDFADSRHFDGVSISDPSIFHLHGQMQGFTTLHDMEEVERQKASQGVKDLFEDTKRNRIWLVIGYSGDSDPIFEKLAEFDEYSNHLYWVGYQDHSPSEDVRGKILSKKYSHFISGYSADSFFDELRLKLIGKQPFFVDQPFTHLKGTFYQKVGEFEKEGQKINPLNTSIKWVDQAIEKFENQKEVGDQTEEIKKDSLTQQASEIWLDQRFDELESFWNKNKKVLNQEAQAYISYAYNGWGISLGIQKKDYQAIEKFQKAIQIKPDYVDAYCNWGVSLSHQGNYSGAIEKYKKAIQIKPDYAVAYCNWGMALSHQENYSKAIEKYKRTIQIKPDYAVAYFNFGFALSNQKKYPEAIEKYWKGVQIKSNIKGYYNLLELLLLLDREARFKEVLKECYSNCSEQSSRAKNILHGMELLAGLKWGWGSKESVDQFYESLPGNVPPKAWEFDNFERFYDQITEPETKQRVRMVLDVWQGKMDPDVFYNEASTWFSDS